MALDFDGGSNGAKWGLVVGTAVFGYVKKTYIEEHGFDPDDDPQFGLWLIFIAFCGLTGGIIGGLTGNPCRDEEHGYEGRRAYRLEL